jgi:manganese transport protein
MCAAWAAVARAASDLKERALLKSSMPTESRSLAEVHRSVHVPAAAGFLRKLFAFSGPGYLVAVGYMDPGNWATSLAGGSAFGYTLLSVVLISSLTAIILQALAARLGVATGQDLAQACRANYRPRASFGLWVLAEVAICATDLAELLGSAVALNLLFGIPLFWGVLITTLDVFLILFLQRRGFRLIEAIVIALIVVIGVCFAYEIVVSHPDFAAVAGGLVPSQQIITDPAMLYVAIGILGATVMPHNLYLHSAVVQTRSFGLDRAGKREAIRFSTIDSTIALMLAFFVNGSILVLAAATFHTAGQEIAEIQDAYQLLSPTLGVPLASTLFAVALLASGQNSTLTGTLSGQIVMEGFLRIRLPPWLRRLVTRLIAVVPAIIVTALYGSSGVAALLILSQVILSLQLPFAIVPLVKFTGSRLRMGEFISPVWLRIVAWAIAAAIIALNLKLLYDFALGD